MSNSLVQAKYSGHKISFNDGAWFNATEAASHFGKRPNDWIALDETKVYIAALHELLNTSQDGNIQFHKVTQNHFIKTKRGKNGGTWMHPNLAVAFARWLDVRFSIWCDLQIKQIISGTHPHHNWKRLRHSATASNKVMAEALRIVREESGKATRVHHYANECRLINWVLTGKFSTIERDALSDPELTLLAKLETRNSVLVGRGLAYQERKVMLREFMVDHDLVPDGVVVASLVPSSESAESTNK